jgi:hypothetical protein
MDNGSGQDEKLDKGAKEGWGSSGQRCPAAEAAA